jgi:hypothetical protein
VRVIPIKKASNPRGSVPAHTSPHPQRLRVCAGDVKEREKHAPEGAEKVLCVRMHIAMRHDLVLEHPQLFLAGQGAVDEQVRRLEVRRVQRKLFDRVAAVSQNARLAIDERDLALYDGGIEKAFVGHAKALGRLVLYTFPRPQRCGNRLEGRC